MVRGFSHGCHGEPQLGCGHFVPVATFSTARPHEDKSNLGAFGDEFTFELSQAAKMPKTILPRAWLCRSRLLVRITAYPEVIPKKCGPSP